MLDFYLGIILKNVFVDFKIFLCILAIATQIYDAIKTKA